MVITEGFWADGGGGGGSGGGLKVVSFWRVFFWG